MIKIVNIGNSVGSSEISSQFGANYNNGQKVLNFQRQN